LTEEIYSRIKNKNHLSSPEAADYYYRIGYYSKAFPWYYQAAKKNDGYSQDRVGEMYQANQDYTDAMLWYMKAHNNGILSATYNIGTLYCGGLGVKQDDQIGLKWYLEAANEGHSISQYEIGLHYEYGIGVQVNLLYSLMWYQKAAIQGHPGAKIKVRRLNNKGFHIADEGT
jgi:TPR repeat protein